MKPHYGLVQPSSPPSSPSGDSNDGDGGGSQRYQEYIDGLYREGKSHQEVQAALASKMHSEVETDHAVREAGLIARTAQRVEGERAILAEIRRREAEREQVAGILEDLRFDGPRKAVDSYGAVMCLGWFQATVVKMWRGERLRNPAGFVHRKLLDREPPPKLPEAQVEAALSWWRAEGKATWWHGVRS